VIALQMILDEKLYAKMSVKTTQHVQESFNQKNTTGKYIDLYKNRF